MTCAQSIVLFFAAVSLVCAIAITKPVYENSSAYFANRENYFSAKDVNDNIILTMLGASTFKSVMTLRNNTSGSNSRIIHVIFSIRPACSKCNDTEFTILHGNEANFTVMATLASNRDLNLKCSNFAHNEKIYYIDYPGHVSRPENTHAFQKYLVLYKCGEFTDEDIMSPRNKWLDFLYNVLEGLILGSIVFVIWYFYGHPERRQKVYNWIREIPSLPDRIWRALIDRVNNNLSEAFADAPVRYVNLVANEADAADVVNA